MMVVRRTFLPLMLIAILLAFATSSVLAKEKDQGKDKDFTSQVTGNSAGTSTLTNPSTCNPPSGNLALFICNFDVMGTYTANPPLGPAGTYSGHATLDYHSYSATSPCATASGAITFTNTATGDQLFTMIDPTHSQVCEIAGMPTIHSETLALVITGGTGIFADASGTIMSNGQTTDTGPGTHADRATLTGSIMVERGNGRGCGNDGHDNGKGNNGEDNGYGHCGNGHGNNDD
jgi:hypothetical protein